MTDLEKKQFIYLFSDRDRDLSQGTAMTKPTETLKYCNECTERYIKSGWLGAGRPKHEQYGTEFCVNIYGQPLCQHMLPFKEGKK